MELTGDQTTAANTGAKPMDDIALNAAIDDSDNRSYGSNLSNLTAQLSAERALNIDLYLGKNVDPAPEGQSNVIDRTVFETVQWILPSLCRIFANGDDVVTLVPQNAQDVDQAKQEAGYLNWLVTQKHPWFELFLEWATDALLTKNAYFLVYRDKSQTVEIEKYTAQTRQGISYLLMDPDVQLVDSRSYPAPDLPPEPVMDPQSGQPIVDANGQPMMTQAMLYDCTIRRRSEKNKLCLRVLPPERVKVDQRAFSWRIDENCNYFEYWEETTLTELRNQGYEIPTDIADDPEIYTQEDYARDQYGERRLERYKPSDPSMRRVKARMIWIRVDYDGDGEAELLQVLRVGRRIISKEEVSRIPVASGVACPLPHRHIGVAIADIVADIQRIKTAILRQGLDNLYIANNPQKVLNEQMVNIDDALISRPGGIIRATDINQIRYEEAPFVFPQAIAGLQYMDELRQNRTGVNYNFSGIDTKDLNNIQPGTINQISSLAAERVVQIARILAFAIEDLFAIIHEQVLKMGHKRESIQLNGQWVDVDPGSWKKRNAFKICVAFASGNKDAQMQRLMLMLTQQQQALQLGIPVVTPENYYNTLVELTKAGDFAAPDRFWTDPKSIPPKPEPGPPPEIIKAQIDNASKEKIAAANLIQAEVESQRRAALEKYNIDATTGLEIVHKQVSHGHTIAIEGLKASHAAILEGLGAKLDATSQHAHKAVQTAHDAIQQQGLSTEHVSNLLDGVLNEVRKTGALATGKRVIRKNDKGEIQGVDILHPETGAVLASHTALKDAQGRVIGMQ
jgi:hypothetical protein